MLQCVICKFDVEIDDIVLNFHNGRCVCEACYERETCTEKLMPKLLRNELIQVLNGAP